MRLIDADALIADIKECIEAKDSNMEWEQVEGLEVALSCVDDAPTIEQRKTGKWVESDTDGFVCSVCRNGYRCQPTLMGKPMFEYCPVCGAKMEAET